MGGRGCHRGYPANTFRSLNTVCEKTSSRRIFQSSPQQICLPGFRSGDRGYAATKDFGALNAQFRFSIQNVSRPKERRWYTSSPQLKRVKRIPIAKEISLNKPSEGPPIYSKRRLSGKVGFKPSVFPCSGEALAQEVPIIGVQRAGFTNDLSSLRPLNSSADICANIKLDGKSSSEPRIEDNSLFGRLPHRSSEPGHFTVPYCHNNLIPTWLRLGGKFRQIGSKTSHRLRVSGSILGHGKRQGFIARSKNSVVNKRSRRYFDGTTMELGNCKEGAGKTEFCRICYSFGKAQFQGHAEGGSSASPAKPNEKIYRSCGSVEGGLLVAAKSSTGLSYFAKKPRNLHDNRRFRHGLGSSGGGPFYRRALEQRSESMAYKSEGALRRLSRSQSFLAESNGEITPNSIGQSIGSFIHPQPGGSEILINDTCCQKTSRIRPGKENHDLSLLPSRSLERRSRQSFKGKEVSRLAFIPKCCSKDIQKVGQATNRPFCLQGFENSKKVCFKGRQRSAGGLHKCLQQKLDISPGVDFSSPILDPASPPAPEHSTGPLHNDSTEMGKSILEVGPSSSRSGTSLSDSKSPPPSSGCSDGPGFTSISKDSFGGMEGTGWSNITKEWKREDRGLLESSWRKSTLKTYSAPWRQWLSWCKKNSTIPSDPSPEELARYLSFLHRVRKLSPATIKMHKSVVATLGNPSTSASVSSSLIVRHMVKAIELSRPPPIKKPIWNVNSLISWMRQETIDQLSLFQVSRRLVLILLLASGRRIHDLTLLYIDQEHMSIDDDAICFWPRFGSKTDKVTRQQSGWKLLRNKEDSFDPIFWSTKLLSLGAERRVSRADLVSLFITTRGRVGPASRSVIAGWVRTAFKEAGIDSSPGSVRSAVASARRDSNMPLDLILQYGNWAGAQNVFKHYFREVHRDSSFNIDKTEIIGDTFVPL